MPRFSAWFFLLAMLAAARAWGQAAYGDWQLHLPARRPLGLADAGSRVYVVDESSFYFYDKNLHTTQLLSHRDGLSDVGVAALAYDSASAQLVVAYRNGNLDLVGASGQVRNVTGLLRKTSQTVKTIYQVQIYNGLAYVGTSLGLVVLDLARLEVRDTYSAIGPAGRVVSTYATAVLHDTIYASTSAGILRARLNSAVNLLDYRSWTTEVPNPGLLTQTYSQLVAYRGHVVAGGNFRGLDYLAGVGAARAWHYSPNAYAGEVKRLHISAGQLLVATTGDPLRRFNLATGRVVDVLPATAVGTVVSDALAEPDGTYYVASYSNGLLRFASATASPEVIRPNAPESTADFGLLADAATNTVEVFSGGFSADNGLQFGNRGGFYEYKDGQWTNYTSTTYPSANDYPNLLDLTRGIRTADGTLYIASYGNGLLQWKGPGQFKQYTYGTSGSPLRSSLDPDQSGLDFVRVTDVAADPGSGRVWVVNRHQRPGVPGLFRFRPSNASWTSVPAYSGFENLDRVVVDNFGNPWATQSRKLGQGLVAFDTISQKPFYFNTSTGLPSNRAYAIVRDRSGDIWVGTDAGVAVYNDPSQLLGAAANSTSQGAFRLPLVTRGTGAGYNTLFSDIVRCIAVDGANRKWLGTPNGLWLFSADCTEALLNFTTANSPLPSNSIVDVAVNDKTGEVFVATDAGLVSYRGSASVTEGTPSCAQVSPNPVRPEFAGTVGISGVVNNAQVRITDVAGHLVYSTRAAGGTVTWNLTDTEGRHVRSGVYLVLTSDAEGKNTCVSKVAVLSK
jgi:hypothetical protein